MAENRKSGNNRLDTTDKGQAYFDGPFGINKGELPVVEQGWESKALTVNEDGVTSLTATIKNALTASTLEGGPIRLDPGEDPNPTGTFYTSSTFLFQSSSNTLLGYDLYFRQNGNVVKWKWFEGLLESGLLYGGVVTYSGSFVYVSPGSGIIVDHNAVTSSEIGPIVDYITWGPITQSITNIATQQVTYIYIDSNSALQQQSTPFTNQQYHNSIPLGAAGHFNYNSVTTFGGSVQTSYDQVSQILTFVDAFGPLKISGYGITGQSSSLKISVGSGTSFIHGGFYDSNPQFPSEISTPSQLTASLVYVYRSGSGVRFDTNNNLYYTNLKPGFYDPGTGTTSSVSNNNWTIQRAYSEPKTGIVYIYYGQNVYPTYNEAVANVSSDSFTEGDTFDYTTFLGFLILKSNTTNITNTSDNKIIAAGLFRGGAGGAGGGSAVNSLDDLSDVSILSPTNGQALVYNSGTSLWENGTPLTSSYALTASFLPVGTYQITSSWAINALTASNISPAITNNVDNRVVTATGGGTINGETNLTFDGSLLSVIGNISASSGITGSLFGTSSWAVSASQALTASFLNGAFLQGGNSFGTTAILGTNDSQSLQFETSGSVRMTISSSGNIGIGTIAPTTTLNVNGTTFLQGGQTTVRGNGATSTTTALRVENANATASLEVLDDRQTRITSDNAALFVQGAGVSPYTQNIAEFQYAGNGNSLIISQQEGVAGLTTSTNANLNINPNGTGSTVFLTGKQVRLNNSSNDGTIALQNTGATGQTRLDFITGSSTIMSISSSGNVGIGTTSPAALLDVNGNTIIRGALTASIISASSWISGSDLRVANTATIGGTLGVTGVTTLQNNLIISGSTTLGSSSAQTVTSNVGFITSPSFVSGWAGRGWRLDYSSNQTSSLDLDNLTVRGQLRVFELVINQIRATNGSLFVSSVGKVVSGSFISGDEYFLTFDTASGDVGHGFAKGDVIRAQRVNRAALTGSGVTQSIAGNLVYQSNLIVRNVNNLSSLTASWISGTIPTGSIAQGMEFVRLGNSESLNRQGTIYLTADDSYAPFIDVVDGVKSHSDWNNASGSGGVKVRMGKLNGITSPIFGPLTASGNNSLYGFWASGSAYLEGGINATFGNIAGWTINTSAITKSGLELNSSGTFFRAGTIASNLTSGIGILLSGSGDAVIGNPTGHRISFIGNNLTLSASNAILKGDTVEISGSNFHLLNGNITASNVRLSGNITATSGSIGGFEITPTEIKSTGSLTSGSFTSSYISLKANGQITGSDVLIHRVISGSLYILLDTVAGLIDARNVGRQLITSDETYAYVGPTSTGTSNPPIIASFPCRLLSGETTLVINYSLEGKFGNALNTATILHGAGVSIQTSSTGSSISSSGNYNSWGTETDLIPATSFTQTSTSASSTVGKILSDTNQQSIVNIPSQFNGKYCRINLKILQSGGNQGSTTQTQVTGFSVVSTRQFAASSSINSLFTPYSPGS